MKTNPEDLYPFPNMEFHTVTELIEALLPYATLDPNLPVLIANEAGVSTLNVEAITTEPFKDRDGDRIEALVIDS